MNPESRTQTALRNSAWGIVGYIAPILVSAFVTPIIVFGLGEHNYGVYTFFISVISILGIIDLGISTAVSRQITEYYSRQEFEKLRELFKTANSLALLIGAVGFVVCITIGIGGHALFSGGVASHMALLYVIIGLIFLINASGLVFITVPAALQRFDIGTKIGTVLIIASSIVNIVIVKTTGSIAGLLAVQLAVSIFTVLASRGYSKRLLPGMLSYSLGWSKDEVRRFYSFGLRAFLANIGNTSSMYFSRLIIPVFLGPSALTYYSVPGSVAQKIPGVMGTLSTVLFPITTSLSSTGETEKIKTVYIRSFRLITTLAAAASSSVIFFTEPILRYWLDQEFVARSSNVLIILALTSFVLALYTPLYNFLLGLGKLKMITITSFAMGGLNMILLLALLPFLGIEGAAWAYLISVLPIAYMLYHTERKYLQFELRTHYYLKLALKTAVTVLTSFLVSHFIWVPLTTSFAILLFTGPASVVTYLALYRLFGFYEKEDWRDLMSFLFLIKRRFIR